jgi:hypothetical protein
MAIDTPAFYGLILRKNARTERFIASRTERLLKRFPYMSSSDLNEDSQIIGLCVAMNGFDLEDAVADLEKDGAVRGQDFVPTSARAGVVGALPSWLVEVSAAELPLPGAAGRQSQKCYRIAAGHESDA